MPIYTVKNAIRHDGQRYKEGEEVEMTAAQAKTLLAMGAIAAAPKGKEAAPKGKEAAPEENAE